MSRFMMWAYKWALWEGLAILAFLVFFVLLLHDNKAKAAPSDRSYAQGEFAEQLGYAVTEAWFESNRAGST